MMPFRYFLDSAYVVPALRKREIGLPMGRRKSVIVGLVLLAHGGLIWGLVNFIAPVPPPIEFVETQVVLEQITPEQPTHTPITPSPQVQQKAVSTPAIQPAQQLKVNENAVIKQVVKSAQQVPTPVTPPAPVHTPVAVAQPVVVPIAKPASSSAPTGKCSQAVPLRITSNLVERNMTVRLVVRRNANNVTAANLQGSTGNASLDALIEQRARGLRFFNKGAECDGLSFTVSVALAE